MQLRPVQSSRIKALGYDQDTWTCYVQFQPNKRERKGAVYAYAGVSPDLFERFSTAPSKGHFFGKHMAEKESHPALRLGEPHTPVRSATAPTPGVLMFRPTEGAPTTHRRQVGLSAKVPKTASNYSTTSRELTQLARERELLVEFFRPMRESTLAAYQAVIEQEEEALAQFQAAEAVLVTQLQQDGRRTGGGDSGK